eukprot:GHVQ01016357.1.p1 GENE.GHVQ01016357.1~~GHVQ01016357.1.p1  ORF type:complete len:115 (-),score=7.69 GHVQ01016357.1:117-461(-)
MMRAAMGLSRGDITASADYALEPEDISGIPVGWWGLPRSWVLWCAILCALSICTTFVGYWVFNFPCVRRRKRFIGLFGNSNTTLRAHRRCYNQGALPEGTPTQMRKAGSGFMGD